MHILVTNDDGPPSPESSPYVHSLVQHLKNAGHTVSVCLPHTQRSWIGKAHMIGQTLKPLYFRPSADVHGDDSEGTTHHRPSPSGDVEEWVLIDGTPASCVQIGLYHFFQNKGPIDLVVSGPNYGRNTTSVFALSSGTLGAALEAAVCRKKSIALSFAFFTRNHDPVIIDAACRHSVRVIEALYRQWPTDGSADLYSVNVPLVEGVEEHKTMWTDMLQNYWGDGGTCFQEVDGDGGDAAEEEARIREGPGGEAGGKEGPNGRKTGHAHKHFKWAPRLTDVFASVDESEPGNDGRTVREGNTSVTPMKASFAHGEGAFSRRELELPTRSVAGITPAQDVSIRGREGGKAAIRAIVAYDDAYVQPLIVSALKSLVAEERLDFVTELPSDESFSVSGMLPTPDSKVLQITPYESIDFEFAASHPQSCLINSYMIRKALIRKHYLSTTVDHWVAKKPASPLKQHVKRSEAFEVDYAEFLDDALVEAFDLRESMDRNADAAAAEREWWILKPGMSDRGQGIRLFSTMEELQGIFDGWEEERPDSDVEDDEQGQASGRKSGEADGDYITTSHLRHFVAQPYIHPPLLVDADRRKFHIRTYVLATGGLAIHVYRPMLALFAAKPYLPPWEHSPGDIDAFLTNTCLQQPASSEATSSARRFWSLPLPAAALDGIFAQICAVTGEAFEAAARAMPVHFQTLPNAFEVFGLDFMVDAAGTAWLLEVNAFPDFKQTGGDLREIVEGFWRGVVREGVMPFFGVGQGDAEGDADMVKVKDIDLGRR
ncbi:Putative tubulin--tyrosine ligase PBY1 [Tolypocladium paradoxum]|uniref:Tubulin--tyrosine ligase PBY1 n=1 Tax=Tolypocladium paradoxum TaxID=94208 RepID=A0A2S4KW91_9HYPO|nr:Putative tubulin--tyrosine ligase PBY1 [Tolypocladium paradoxum]